MTQTARRFGRWQAADDAPVQLDGLARPDAELGLVALWSPHDPPPDLVIEDGVVSHLDGRRREDFDIVDAYIADHGLDLQIAPTAMAIDDVEAAGMFIDPGVPRQRVVDLVAGMTPAKLAAVVRQIRPFELTVALAKMRARRTPVAQAHVTNRNDDPLLIAADAATAIAYGFREVGTAAVCAPHAPSNAVALLIGSQVGRAGALTRCAAQQRTELAMGLRGLVSYAESVSLPGHESALLDAADTPWSKTFLVAAYASRGVKMRVATGGAAQALRAGAQGRSMLYLESRSVALAKACGTQGVRNGGTESAGLAAAVPAGVLGLGYENLMAMARGLETYSANDCRISRSDGRRFAAALPTLLAGCDGLAGISAVPDYDNAFAAANFDAADLDELLVLQRDWGVDLGLRSPTEEEILTLRRRAAQACRAVYSWLGLADFSDAHVESVVGAQGSRDTPGDLALTVLQAAQTITHQGITGLDVAVALDESGYEDEAERVLAMLRERVRGDQLQTAAIFDARMRCLSAVTDPNDYAGPGTGYAPSDRRRERLASVRGERSVADERLDQDELAVPGAIPSVGQAFSSDSPRDVVVAVSPAFLRGIWATLTGLNVIDVLDEVLSGLEEEGCTGRVVRVATTVDLDRLAHSAAVLSGSGIGIGVEGRGGVQVVRRGAGGQVTLEAVADRLSPRVYRAIGVNAARHAKAAVPLPVQPDERVDAGIARYHVRSVAYVTLENEQRVPAAPPELLEVPRD